MPCRALAGQLLADRVQRAQFAAAHYDHLRPQTAMVVDPGADFRRIEPHDQRTAVAGRHQRTRGVVVIGRCVEAQGGAPRYANVVSRDDTGEQGAGRQAWPVNDNPLAEFADLIEFLNIRRRPPLPDRRRFARRRMPRTSLGPTPARRPRLLAISWSTLSPLNRAEYLPGIVARVRGIPAFMRK